MTARECRKVHDIQQAKKMVPLITREASFDQHVSKLVFGANIFNLILGSKLILANNHQAQLCGSLTHVSSLDFFL